MYSINKRLIEICSGVWMPLMCDVVLQAEVGFDLHTPAGSSLGRVAVAAGAAWGGMPLVWGMSPCRCVCGMCGHCHQLSELCCPFPSLAQRMAVPSCAPNTQRTVLCWGHQGIWAGTGVSGQALRYLGRHWAHPDTGCAGGTADKWGMALPLLRWEGGAEARAQCSHGESASSTSAGVIWEKAGCRLVVGGCGCRQLGGGCGVGGSWVVLEETWNVTNQCLFHSYLSHMHFKAFTIWDDAGRTNNECRQSLNWLYTQIHILFWKTTLPLTLIGNHRSPCNIDGPLWNWC